VEKKAKREVIDDGVASLDASWRTSVIASRTEDAGEEPQRRKREDARAVREKTKMFSREVGSGSRGA